MCGICDERMEIHSPVNSIQTICCDSGKWFHKMCLKKIAFSFTDQFDCPSCGNKDEFRLNMKFNGIFIPNTDYLPNYDSQIDDDDGEDEIVQKPKRR